MVGRSNPISVIWLRLPKVRTSPRQRPDSCPHCGSEILQRWGRIAKPVRDTHELEVEVHRYRCTECGRTFRAYPKGVDRSERTVRLRQMAALTWALGLSLESVVDIFTRFGVSLSRTTIWRDGQGVIEFLPERRRLILARLLNVGEKNVWMDDHEGGVILVLELKRNKKVMLELTGESDPEVVRRWLKPVVEHLGLEMDLF